MASTINQLAEIPSATTDLNDALTEGASQFRFFAYGSNASNKPTGNSGVTLVFGSGTYRGQFAFELAGAIYARYYNSGTITSWVKVGGGNS